MKIDPTNRLASEIQFYKLRNENKSTKKTYFELYASYPIQPRLHGTIKVHNLEKKLSLASHCFNNSAGISKYLFDVIQLILTKS